MAEFVIKRGPSKGHKTKTTDGFDAFGKSVSPTRRQVAYEHCKTMGLTDNEDAWSCVTQVANAIERDEPYEAMRQGMKFLDLTGTYRVMAVLCTA